MLLFFFCSTVFIQSYSKKNKLESTVRPSRTTLYRITLLIILPVADHHLVLEMSRFSTVSGSWPLLKYCLCAFHWMLLFSCENADHVSFPGYHGKYPLVSILVLSLICVTPTKDASIEVDNVMINTGLGNPELVWYSQWASCQICFYSFERDFRVHVFRPIWLCRGSCNLSKVSATLC